MVHGHGHLRLLFGPHLHGLVSRVSCTTTFQLSILYMDFSVEHHVQGLSVIVGRIGGGMFGGMAQKG